MRRADNYHHPVPLSRNLGTLTSWNPLGHSRPVTGLLYLYSKNVSIYIFFIFFFKWHNLKLCKSGSVGIYRVTIKEIDTFNIVLKRNY